MNKCRFYFNRALSGEQEPKSSRQRQLAIEEFYNYIIPDDDEKLDKWDRLGYHVAWEGAWKIVNLTQKYTESIQEIQKFNSMSYERRFTKANMIERFSELTSHQLRHKVIRVFPPCNSKQEMEV